MHVAVGLGAEVDRLAIGRPGGTGGVETPLNCREVSGGASDCRNDADVVLHVPALRAHKRDRLPVRRPGGRAALRENGWKGSSRAIDNIEEEQRGPAVVPHFLVLGGGLIEGDRLAIGRPRRRGLAQVAAGELARCTAGERSELPMAV